MNRRFEHKHLFHEAQKDFILNEINHRLSGSFEYKRYTNQSTYFDTTSLDCYWAKVEGEPNRYKVRLRQHESGKSFLEWKIREDELNYKVRQPLTSPEATGLDVLRLWPHLRLHRPAELFHKTVVVTYLRHEWAITPGLRLTLDEKIRFRRSASQVDRAQTKLILEVKTFKPGDYLNLKKTLSHLHLEAQTISKYCLAVEDVGIL